MIICFSRLVISFLIPLANERQETMFVQCFSKHFSHNSYTCTDLFMSVQNTHVIPASLLRFSSILYINKCIIALYLIFGSFVHYR